MAYLCLPLSEGEDAFELNSVQLKLEAIEKQIRNLVEKQAQLKKRRAVLETFQADAHKSRVSTQHDTNTPTTSTPCVSLHRPRAPRTRYSQMSFTTDPGSTSSGRCKPSPGRQPLLLRWLRSLDLHPVPLRSPLQDGMRWETPSSGTSVLC